MEPSAKNSVLKWVVMFVMVLLGTNLATYLIFGDQGGFTGFVEENGQRIIEYKPENNREGNVRELETETEIFWETLESISNHYFYEVDTSDLIKGAIQGMIDSIDDPQVRFYDPDQLEELLMDTRGTYGGIGVRIIESNEHIVVFETFADSPAKRAGFTPGDRILEADGIELTGEGINHAAEVMRGPPDTHIDIKVQRPGADKPIEMTVSREEIQVTTVTGEMLDDGLGYIKIENFDSNTDEKFTEIFQEIEQAGLGKGLILDLRNNPGGLVDQAVGIAQQIVPEGEIVRLIGQNDEVKTVYYSEAERKPYPIVVLVNEESASASELLAGALQDRDAALLVGQKTFGKASVQQLEEISDHSAIMLTVANYFTPSGHNIDEHGIKPDYEVEMPEVLRYYHYFHPDRLELDDYGEDVEILQEMLGLLGFEIEVTGYFDEQTFDTLTNFQVEAGLESSGMFDDKTWVELRSALDTASREQDKQLDKALQLLEQADLWNNTGGNE